MDENNIKKKKKIKLKLKTFADLKRFKSRQLHKIVEKFRKKNKGMNLEELIENAEFFKSMGYLVRQTLINKSDANKKKTIERLEKEIEEGNKEYKEYKTNLKEGKLTEKEQKKMQKEYEDKKYKMAKEIYTKDLGPKNQEKPKNPKVQRAVNNVKNVAKTVGKGIATGATAVAGAVAFPFVMAYKGAKAGVKALGTGIKRLKRGATVATLTAGKVVKNTVEPTVNKVKETVKEVKENVQETKFEVNKDVYDNSSEKVQREIFNRDYEKALKEDAKREREAQRRENLHMDKEEQPINHKEAIEKVEGEVLTEEEVKKVYGDQEK